MILSTGAIRWLWSLMAMVDIRGPEWVGLYNRLIEVI